MDTTVLGNVIRQAVEQSVPVSWLAQDIRDQGNLEVWVDLIKRTHLTFPYERIAGVLARATFRMHMMRDLSCEERRVGPPEKPPFP
jgi:hypothetical protein